MAVMRRTKHRACNNSANRSKLAPVSYYGSRFNGRIALLYPVFGGCCETQYASSRFAGNRATACMEMAPSFQLQPTYLLPPFLEMGGSQFEQINYNRFRSIRFYLLPDQSHWRPWNWFSRLL